MVTVKKQNDAAELAGVTRWIIRRWEKQFPQLKRPGGEYNFDLLMTLASRENPTIVRNLQAECHGLVGKIGEPGPLLLTQKLLQYFANNPSVNLQTAMSLNAG